MKAVCVLDSVSRANGGIFEAEKRLQNELAMNPGFQVEVLGLVDEYTEVDLAQWTPLRPRVFPVRGPRSFGFSPSLRTALQASEADIAYGAGLWKYSSLALLLWSTSTARPLVVSPHGMLDGWALRHSRWKKRIAAALYEDRFLRRAFCLRALCGAEREAIRQYGLRNPVCVIPNAIDLPKGSPVLPPPWAGRIDPSRKVLFFLGRLHPKKGLPNLLSAWDATEKSLGSHSPDWHLVIAGWSQGDHEEKLRQQAAALGLGGAVVFAGPLHGDAKDAAFHAAHAVVLPSFSEGLPMAVLEAWAYAKPVLMTPECNLPEGFAAGAAVRIRPEPRSIAEGLRQLFSMSDGQREDMGRRGRELVRERFNWSTIAREMHAVFEWVLGQRPQPACVSLD